MGGAQPANPRPWFHLAVTSDPKLQPLIINGRIVAQHRATPHLPAEISLAQLRLSSTLLDIEQDDLVAFDRILAPEELSALAERGRGGWRPEVERPALAATVWNYGWLITLI